MHAYVEHIAPCVHTLCTHALAQWNEYPPKWGVWRAWSKNKNPKLNKGGLEHTHTHTAKRRPNSRRYRRIGVIERQKIKYCPSKQRKIAKWKRLRYGDLNGIYCSLYAQTHAYCYKMQQACFWKTGEILINYRNIKQWACDHHDAHRHKVRQRHFIRFDDFEYALIFTQLCLSFFIHKYRVHSNCLIRLIPKRVPHKYSGKIKWLMLHFE